MPSAISEHTVPWPDEYARAYREAGYWAGRSWGELLAERAAAVPDAPALVDGVLRLTHGELWARAEAAAARLTGLGIGAGDRIVVQLPNGWEFVVLTLACLRLGAVPVMALPAHRRAELSHLVEHAEAAAIAVPDRLRGFDHQALAHELAAAYGCAEQSDGLRVLVAGDEIRPGSLDLRGLCGPRSSHPAGLPSPGEPYPGPHPDPESVAVFLLSGGTTGLPKLIARTHDDYAYNARASAELCGFDADTVYLVSLPAGHNFPLACPGILGTLLVGGRVVMLPSPEPARAFEVIAAEGVTHTAVVPAVAGRWLEHAATHGPPGAGSGRQTLALLQVGGARLADELARRVRPVLGARLQQVFGMAEGLLNYTRLDDPDEVVCGSQGRPLSPADEVRLVDELDQDVPAGQPGSLLTRGPYTPRGYYRAPEQNSRAFTPDGWYRSGDICRRTPEGNLVVEGRDKDMINRGGEKVSAEEVENLVYRLPAVRQVAAVAMPDPELGERVCLYVVPHAGAGINLEDVRESMERVGVARFKLPEHLVLVEELPTTKVGKIDKKALRVDIAERLAARGMAAGGAGGAGEHSFGMSRRDVGLTLPWMRAGTAHFRATLDSLTDDELRAPSALPGWTRAHVVGHVARNAEALARLAAWARTGVETPMYRGPDQRSADIEESARLPGPVLRSQVAATAAELDEALGALTADQWSATVRSGLGRRIPGAEVPWMRVREVWLHAVDLDAGATVHDMPADVVDVLADDVVAVLSAKRGCPDVSLTPTDRPRGWRLGADPGAAPVMSAPAASIVGWLTGRVPPEELAAPGLPTWL